MDLIKFIVTCSLTFSLTRVHGKVVYRSGNVTKIMNNKTVTISDYADKLVITLSTTVPSITDSVESNIKRITEILNSLDDYVEKKETKIHEAESKNLTSEFKSEDCPFKNQTENLTALILTSYIEQGRIAEARNASKVNSSLFLGFESYSGYFTVNKTYNSNIFFWYFPVVNKPVETTPWIIWLQGGPGASSMNGLFEEIGPFSIESNFVLKRNAYSWLQNHSIVFFDNPVGTGFSFTEHNKGYTRDMPTYSSQLYSAFEHFVQVFPELRSAPLYVSGESYAGKYVPSLGVEIHKRMNQSDKHVNLQGFIIGNAYVDPAVMPQMPRPFYNFGLIGEEQLKELQPIVDSMKDDIKANNSMSAKARWTSLLSMLMVISHQSHGYNFLNNDLVTGTYTKFLNAPYVQKAIHVRPTKYSFVNMTVNFYLAGDFLSSGKGHFETLLEHYRVLAYCGQLDLMIPCISTSENYRTWKWNGTEQFIKAKRFPYLYKNKRAGYYKSGGGLTEVVMLGAGHMVPMDKPGPAQDLVTRWTHNQTLSRRFTLLEGSFVTDYIRNNTILPYL